MPSLSDYISVNRRYSRSVNIERDLESAESVLGYTPTSIAVDVLTRLLRAFKTPNSVRAWTLTGPYGTGKSAFGHFLTSLCAPAADQASINAFELLERKVSLKEAILESIPEQGFLRAVSTGQREPLANSIIRALNRGMLLYWKNKRGVKPKILKEIKALHKIIENGATVESPVVVSAVKEVARVSKTGLLLILDELGKSFEFAAEKHAVNDLYLLQQIAELPAGEKDPKVYLLGLLHQSFADYSQGLSEVERNEWAKIQGRFEDIPYADSTEGMLRLIGNAIDQTRSKPIAAKIQTQALNWKGVLSKRDFPINFSSKNISKLFPLHPIAAVALPVLCSKFSQNGRTLFSFLSSDEPHSLNSFLKQEKSKGELLGLFKLDRVYDYFVEAAGTSFSLRPQFQRWVEQ